MSNSEINIKIKNKGYYNIHFDYNYNLTFDDLLEYVSYNISNICPCYKFFLSKNSFNYMKEKQINGNEKLDNYLNYYNNTFSLYIPNEKCNCNQYVKKLYNKSKITIINELIKIDEEKNSYKNELDSLKKDDNIYNYLTLKREVKHLEEGNIKKKNEIVDLNNKIKEFNKKKQDCKYTENILTEKIRDLNEQLNQFNIEEQIFKVKRNQLEEEIKTLNEQIEIKQQNERDFKLKESQLNKEIDYLRNQIEILNKQELISKRKEKELNENKENLKYKKSLFQLTNNQLIIDNVTGKILGNEKPENYNKSFTDFYDVIIDIKSIKDINKGWQIKMKKKVKKIIISIKILRLLR